MTDMLKFQGKLALVTGSGRGIGKEIAVNLAKDGADIVVNYFRNRKPAEETLKTISDLGRRGILVKADIGTRKGIDKLVTEIEDEFGYLDIFISNAGSGYNRPLMEQRYKGWDWTMNINARAFLFLIQKIVPLMKKRGGGKVVAISSPGSHRVLPDYSVVGASKSALEALVRYASVELAPENIVVNAVSPGIVLTESLKFFDATKEDDSIIERITGETPAKRLVTPHDVAEVTNFLCSDSAEMIRGQVITVDGGYSHPAR